MKHLLFSCGEETAAVPAGEGDPDAWLRSVQDVRLDGDRLQDVSAAACLRARVGAPMVTDGPFAETTEQIVGTT